MIHLRGFALRLHSIYERKLRLAAVALGTLLSLSGFGCSNLSTTATTADANFQTQTMSGSVHGGQSPISNATVTLYAVGTSGYGSAATALATSTTSANGSFTLNLVATQPATLNDSYACPTSNTLVYLVSSGGITDGSGLAGDANSAAVLLAALGNCAASGALSVNINEVSTAASVTALAQYINPGGSTPASATIGSPGTTQAQTGILNAFNNVPLLENLANGTQVNATTLSGTAASVANVTVTASTEPNKINTIADILAQCVNDNPAVSSADCTTLFTNATPPNPAVTSQSTATFNTAVDTLQAAYYMATNPTDGSATNLGNLYTLASAASPFQPTLTAQPTDWTVGILFASGSTATTSQPTSPASLPCSNGATNGYLINNGYGLSIDASGNVWMANGGETAPTATAGDLAEMSPNGTPLYCSPGVSTPKGGAAIDTAGNVWLGSTALSGSTGSIYKYDGTNFNTITTPFAPYAVAPDGVGHVDFTTNTGTKLYQLPSIAVAEATSATLGTTQPNAYGLAIDTRGTVVTAHGATSATVVNTAINAFNESTVGGTSYTSSTITSAANFSSPDLFAVDASGHFWFSNDTGTAGTAPGNTTSYIIPAYSTSTSGAAVTVTYTESAASSVFLGGLSNAKGVAIDGAGNVWFADAAVGTGSKYAVTELSKTGAALSPTVVVTSTTQNGGFQKMNSLLNTPYGIAVDPSGNVWVSMVTANQVLSILTEIVGAAVPVVTPISKQLSSGTGPVLP